MCLFPIQVNLDLLIGLLLESRTVLKSPEILLILLTCPLLQEDTNVMNGSLLLAIVIAHLPERTLETLSKQIQQIPLTFARTTADSRTVQCDFVSAGGWWASLAPSILLKHILVFKKALAFMLKNGLLATHNPGVKYLLEVLKLLYKVSVFLCWFSF